VEEELDKEIEELKQQQRVLKSQMERQRTKSSMMEMEI